MKLFKITKNPQNLVDEALKLNPLPILYVKNLTKKYPGKKAPAINNISFNIYPGQFHAFIGANGAGKTTTIKSLIGAYSQWSGVVLINGIKNTKEEAKRKLGYIPENARFPEKFSAYQYLVWMAKLSGLKTKNAKIFAIEKLRDLNLLNLKKKSPNTFSSGQKKKILLAQALIHNPDVLIMDEPAANLDPKARIEFFDTLLELKKHGKAIFVSSHILAELDKYADSATILDGGKIVFTGTIKELMKKYIKDMYLLQTSNQEVVNKFLASRKVNYKYDPILESFTIYFENQKDIYDLQKKIIASKGAIIKFEQIKPSLDDIYKELIKKGSVDTMNKNSNIHSNPKKALIKRVKQ